MIFNVRRVLGALTLGVATLASLPAMAGPYSQMIVFGDSLSDTGNLSLVTGGTQPPAGQPYFNGRFSDGPVWVETLAAGLGLAAMPSLAGGTNYAFAGARTGASSTPPGLLAQAVGMWGVANAVADPNALYVVVGGGNDMRDARSAFTGNTAADDAGRQSAAQAAVDNIFQTLGFLASRGAQHVLLANLPDLGFTPEAAMLGVQAASADASARFNLLMAGLEAIAEAAFGLDIDFLDMDGIAATVRDDAINNNGGLFGITSTSLPCAGFFGSAGAACDVSLFSDALHPSARAHALIGAYALQLVPEPGSIALVAAALVALSLSRRRA